MGADSPPPSAPKRSDHPTESASAERSACPVCGNRVAFSLLEAPGFRLLSCTACELVEIRRCSGPAAESRHQGGKAFPVSESVELLPPEDRHPYDNTHLGRRSGLREARRQLRRFVSRVPRGGRVLLVGCGRGFLVEAARLVGLRAVGIEADPACVAWAHEHLVSARVLKGRLESMNRVDFGLKGEGEEAGFDLIQCGVALQQAQDPNRFARALAGMVRLGGMVYLDLPDFGHWRRPADICAWLDFWPERDSFYFSRKTLVSLMYRHGFELFQRRSSWSGRCRLFFRRATAPRLPDERDLLVLPPGSEAAAGPRLALPGASSRLGGAGLRPGPGSITR